MKVAKFGGSSLANASQIKKVVDIVLSDKDRRIVVVSAPGKRVKEDTKVTDLLIALADAILAGKDGNHELKIILERFKSIIDDLGLSNSLLEEIDRDIKKRISEDKSIATKFTDGVKALGEDINAKVVASYINSLGVEAKYVNPKDAGLLLSEEFGNAAVLDVSYKNLAKLKDESAIVVFPGFFGYTQKGDVVTFPRGGSDITGSILAKAVNAEVYENFTDVDGVLAASPSIVDNPKLIDEFTYREMRELSYGGFNVLHAEALQPVYEANIPVHILNTNNTASKGTKIVAKRDKLKNPVVGVSGESDFSCLYVSKYLMNREVGFGRKLLAIIEDEGIPYQHAPSGIDNISVIVRGSTLTKEKEKRIYERVRDELNVDNVFFDNELALVMLVGEGMQEVVGISARAMNAIEKANVNIEMLNQSISEASIMIGVKEKDLNKAINAVYKAFFTEQ
ncbi:aspartate kinase [Brachyspira pilosicoli]|uniref:Aspartokinase n=2 Tax=Brachyspira pilosicoli TaxID=52584 RepID=A0A3B6VND6_BRAPL|nr:aspartate kinase [Brachyspira pilosicoli]AGA67248.1 aspartate kinase [Brachyspira pilosicoli P43/6/78]MBW5392132.1 aspartate kinase [Brachyspira pilosicoli]WIH81051.1 aspartate kinase [Brachyspira pilosicoli]WIH85487.1 aspartate kinase [Brachyspira pilosicoli]SUW04857.1 aspartate kinase [Brachyspira pilosicoli]